MENLESELSPEVKRLGIKHYARHILFCAGDKCCHKDQGEEVWSHLKARCQDLGLTNNSVYRTKVQCLRICKSGPIAVVYPEGTWYARVDKERCDAIVNNHLVGGKVLQEGLFAVNESMCKGTK